MITLLADVNIEGHVTRLVALMRTPYWLELWDDLGLRYQRFRDVGLAASDSDSHVWQFCQQHQLCLLTSNRNDDGLDSLEATIRVHSTASSLPVFTIPDADSIMQSGVYAERVVEKLYDYLLRIETVRGTGRLFLP